MRRAWVEWQRNATRGYTDVHRWWPIGGPPGEELPPDAWDPPVLPVSGRGYPRIFVELDDFVFEFISTLEMAEIADVLDRQLVDQATSKRRWYRKLPASAKGKHSRHRAAAFLRRVASAYEAQTADFMKERAPVPQGPGPTLAPNPRSEIRL